MNNIISNVSESVNVAYDWYTKHELEPALGWLETEQAIDFVNTFFPKHTYGIFTPNEELNSCYLFYRKSSPLYIGEAANWGSLAVHMHKLCLHSEEYFGLKPEEVQFVQLKFDTKIISSREERLKRVENLIKLYKPILQQGNNDRWIPKGDREKAVHIWYNDTDELQKVLDLVIYKLSFLFGWPALLRRTPCADNTEIDIPYGLDQRIGIYIASLSKQNRAELLMRLGSFFSGGFWVTTKTAVTLLSRLLAVDQPEDLMKTAKDALEYRIRQATDTLKVMGWEKN